MDITHAKKNIKKAQNSKQILKIDKKESNFYLNTKCKRNKFKKIVKFLLNSKKTANHC